MVTLIGYVMLILYCFSLCCITCYCLMEFYLLVYYMRSHGKEDKATLPHLKTYPFVTIQLPIYNERFVVSRLIDTICALDYPRERMEIQVLDDSTDDTLGLSAQKVDHYRSLGFQIRLIRRTNRSGFKAGALANGMESALGEFFAIFDADFLPKPDFLKQTIPFFNNAQVGVVQTRWGHLNENYSLLTRLQAFQLNVHFTVEQKGRQAAGLPLQFNGTAGAWRKAAILDAGGWQSDTLTEDLDLSYRAQLRGWKIHYVESIEAPAELPADMQGIKSQQYRWMKGGAETARKILPQIWKSSLPLRTKLFASHHLLSSAVFVLVFVTGITTVPLLFTLRDLRFDLRYFSFFLIGLFSIIFTAYMANAGTSWKGMSVIRKMWTCAWYLPVLLALSMGLSLHNTIAVLQGFAGKKTAFIRTPKFALDNYGKVQPHRFYQSTKFSWITLFEGILALYFLSAIIFGVCFHDYTFLLFHILLTCGYGAIFLLTLLHRRR